MSVVGGLEGCPSSDIGKEHSQTPGVGMDELQISPADPHESPAKEQQAAGVGILLQIMMLVLSFVLGHVLRRHRFYYLPEASASLLIGLIVGGLANISNTENSIRSWFNFHEEFFLPFPVTPDHISVRIQFIT